MFKKTVSSLILVLLVVSMLTVAIRTQPVKAQGTIYINADGSVTGTTDIQTADNVTYVFAANISDPIIIQKDNITLDGNGYTLQGAGSGNGIDLESRTNVTVQNTTITAFNYGVFLNSSSSDNSIVGNNITLNYYYGIFIYSSSNNNSINGNYITNNSAGILLYSSLDNSISRNSITTNNHIGIELLSSSSNSISGNNITANNDDGIEVGSSSNNSISGNTITTNNLYGVYLGSSSNNSISRNNITTNKYWGIQLLSSFSNCINGNNITNNAYAIDLSSSSSNSISGNNITTNNNDGVSLAYSSSNCISGNDIDNNLVGIELFSHENNYHNSIYHDNFINNTRQVYDYSWDHPNFTPSDNTWDNGYPSGGNYWSDYDGTDAFGGPYQNATGSDGIGDSPYSIDSNNADHYPLMNPISPAHDIAVASVSPSKTVVGHGYSVTMNVSLMNLGDFAENLNLITNTINVTSGVHTIDGIETESISGLMPNQTQIITIQWTTTDWLNGNYMIQASASVVPGETNTANNNCTGGNVLVTIPGDINGDLRVNLQDLVLLANAYGTNPNYIPRGFHQWNPNADIDSSGIVGLSDLVILEIHYARATPKSNKVGT